MVPNGPRPLGNYSLLACTTSSAFSTAVRIVFDVCCIPISLLAGSILWWIPAVRAPQIQPPTLRDSRRISCIITLLLHWSNFMRLGHSALCILTLIILTPCAQIFVRPPAFICAALTIVTVRVTLSGSTMIMARDANSSSLNHRVIFGIIFPCDRAPTSTSLIL